MVSIVFVGMWSALKSDLLDFVTTIQEDTSKTLSLVLGDEEVDVSVSSGWDLMNAFDK